MLDGTYKVNNLRIPLYTVAIVDAEGHGQPVAHAFLANEDQQHIELFLGDVVNWCPSVSDSVVITDKDFAEINAVTAVMPSAQLFLCHFHVMKSFTDEIKRLHIEEGTVLLTVCNVT